MKYFHPQFAPMSKAYESLKNTISVFKDEKKDLDIMSTNNTGEHISNPLEFGCAWEIEKLSQKMRLEFVTYIISMLSNQNKFKNLTIDERSLINHFDNNDTAFDPSDVVEYFDNKFDSNDLTVRVYDQILATARRSLPWNLGKQIHEVERFGKDSSGIVLSFRRGYSERNTNTTTELIKLLRIIYCDRNPLYVTAIQLDIGDTLTKDDLGFCEHMRAYQNGKLKIKFETKERADEICKLLLGD